MFATPPIRSIEHVRDWRDVQIRTIQAYAGGVDVNDKRPVNEDGRGYSIGADYNWGFNTIRAQWLQNRPRYGSDDKTNAFGMGYQYDLSHAPRFTFPSLASRTTPMPARLVWGATPLRYRLDFGLTTLGDGSITEVVAGSRHSF